MIEFASDRTTGWRGVLLATAMVGSITASILVSVAPSVLAQNESPNAKRAESVAAGLNCPICDGYTLRDCPLPICAQMRDEIRVMLDEGSTDQDVVDHFVDLHGPQVLNMPPARGAFLAAWLLPIFVLAGGALLVVRALAAARIAGASGDSIRSSDESSSNLGHSVADAEGFERVEQLLADRDAR